MGSALSQCLVPESPDDVVARHLVRVGTGIHKGDSCLIRSVKASSSGAGARVRLEADCAALQHHWKQVQAIRKENSRKGRAGLELGPDAAGRSVLLLHMLDAQNSKGETALSVAAQLGLVEAVQYLLGQGANPWLADRPYGRTPLHAACLNGHHAVVKVLLERLPTQWQTSPSGTSTRYVNCTTVSGFTPLHCAACSGDGPTIRAVLAHQPALLAHNAHTSSEETMSFPIGTTALHVAASKGNMRIAKELLRHYARHASSPERELPDPRLARNNNGDLPWEVAHNMHDQLLSDLLHPTVPLTTLATLLPEPLDNSLQALASAALQQHLLKSLGSVQQQQQQQQRAQQALADAQASAGDDGSDDEPIIIAIHDEQGLLLPALRPSLYGAAGIGGNEHALDMAGHALDMAGHALDMGDVKTVEVMVQAIPEPGQGPSQQPGKQQHATLPSPHLRSPYSTIEGADGEYGGLLSREVGLCNICMDMEARMELAPCTHRLCEGCVRHMVHNMKTKPVDCPYCRRPIAGFVAAV